MNTAGLVAGLIMAIVMIVFLAKGCDENNQQETQFTEDVDNL